MDIAEQNFLWVFLRVLEPLRDAIQFTETSLYGPMMSDARFVTL